MHTSIYMRAYMNTWMHRTTQALPDSGCCLSRDLEGMDAFRKWSPGFTPQATSSFEATGRSEVSSLRPTTADSTRETRNATTSSLGATSNASTSRSYTSTSRESSQGTYVQYCIVLLCVVLYSIASTAEYSTA